MTNHTVHHVRGHSARVVVCNVIACTPTATACRPPSYSLVQPGAGTPGWGAPYATAAQSTMPLQGPAPRPTLHALPPKPSAKPWHPVPSAVWDGTWYAGLGQGGRVTPP